MGSQSPPGDAPHHVLWLLEAVQRRVAEELDAVLDQTVRDVGYRRLRILQLIPAEGARQQDLADRALVTKQALAELIAGLEADGLVERTPDQRDGRAWLVVRSRRGDQVSDALDASLISVEATLSRLTSEDRFRTFLEVMRDVGRESV